MKQVLVVLIAFLYFSFSIGFQVNMHFCAGELVSFSITQQTNSCKKCGSKSMKGCCKDIQKQLKVSESDFFKSICIPVLKNFQYLYLLLSPIKLSFIGSTYSSEPVNLLSYFLDSSKPIFLMNCTFII